MLTAGQRRIEVIGDPDAVFPSTRCSADGASLQRYQAHKGHAVLRNDDLLAGCRSVHELREIRFCFVEVKYDRWHVQR